MSFLSAAFLIALPLVAVPVAIHLYRGRQRDVILWGAMQFLAAAVTKGRRMERLEELLLMALRFAAVAAVVLALAQPMVRSSWLGNLTEREVILLLDNSLSMSREEDGTSPSERLREQALDVIDSLTAADGVQVLLASGSEWATAEPIPADSEGKRRLRKIVEDTQPTRAAADLLGCLQAAVNLESENEIAARRIVVFTDGQALSWRTDSGAAWRQLGAARDEASFPIAIEVMDCAVEAEEFDNRAVAAVHAAKHLVRPGEVLELSADIVNTGDIGSPKARVEWLIGDEVVQTTTIGVLQPGAQTQASASLPMRTAGIHAVTCRIADDDQVPLDQENSLVVEVADELPVLFVATVSGNDATVWAAELFSAALGFKNNEAQPWHSIFRPEIVSPAELATHSLADCRAIIMNDPKQLDRATLDRLDSYVRSGGGLWIALGSGVDRAAFNRDWHSDGDGLSPLPLESLEVIEKEGNAAATVHPPSRDHVATLQLANTTQLDIDEARIRQRWLFDNRPMTGRGVSALLESGSGRPLVVENFVGQGRVLVQSFPIGLEWSNLPLLKAYVVMIHDWLSYITAPTMARYNLSPGAPIVATPPKNAADATAAVITPQGREVKLSALDSGIEAVCRYTQTQLPGTYRVRFKAGGSAATELPFHVQYDARESHLEPLTEADRDKLLAPAGVRFGSAVTPIVRASDSAPRREPFWGYLLAALVALVVSELLMSGFLARQRSGFSISTS